MNYVVVDFEWNQAMSSKSSVFNKLPIHLLGEIIEIGAVRMNPDMTPGEEFTVDIKPVYFKQMHYKVKKLTGFDSERLSKGVSFKEAFQRFREFCGDDVTFLTWGNDDKTIFEQNIIIHDLDWDWIKDWLNLQVIYNLQTTGDRNQKSLATAMEHFDIEQTRVAHDALGDAYNTALVCSLLDMEDGVEKYPYADKLLSSKVKDSDVSSGDSDNEPLQYDTFGGFSTKSSAFASPALSQVSCPDCNEMMDCSKWINQGDQRYMNLYTCACSSKFIVRLKFKKDDDNLWTARRIVYRADDIMSNNYRSKLAQSRRRGRGHTSRARRPANKSL